MDTLLTFALVMVIGTVAEIAFSLVIVAIAEGVARLAGNR
jgi:hypothetical protein